MGLDLKRFGAPDKTPGERSLFAKTRGRSKDYAIFASRALNGAPSRRFDGRRRRIQARRRLFKLFQLCVTSVPSFSGGRLGDRIPVRRSLECEEAPQNSRVSPRPGRWAGRVLKLSRQLVFVTPAIKRPRGVAFVKPAAVLINRFQDRNRALRRYRQTRLRRPPAHGHIRVIEQRQQRRQRV